MKFLRNRLSSALLVLFGASLITFTLARVIPSDPSLAYIGPKATAAEAAQLKITLGLDQPIPFQYFKYVMQTLHGNWGYSLSTKQSVLTEIASRLPATLELIIFAICRKISWSVSRFAHSDFGYSWGIHASVLVRSIAANVIRWSPSLVSSYRTV